ncbi:MAG: hypothetical protein ABIH39_05595 [Candidatus Margulisiibacteriota bacterium]
MFQYKILITRQRQLTSFQNVLEERSFKSTSLIIKLLEANSRFLVIARATAEEVIKRDEDDNAELGLGITESINAGIIKTVLNNPPYTKVLAGLRTPEEIAGEILSKCDLLAAENNLILLYGASGTGKGTAVAALSSIVPNSIAWSNGSVFRSLAFLAIQWHKEQHIDFNPASLSMDLVNKLAKSLSYEKNKEDIFDIRIHCGDIDYWVGDVKNTILNSAEVSKNTPAVARYAQGVVIYFALEAIGKLKQAGYVVILEGRKATLDCFPGINRFELVLKDPLLIGKRRAAQRILPRFLETIKEQSLNDDELKSALEIFVRDDQP